MFNKRINPNPMRKLTEEETDQINEVNEIRDNAIEKILYLVASACIIAALYYVFTQS